MYFRLYSLYRQEWGLGKQRERNSTTPANTPQTASSKQHARLIPLCDTLLLFVYLGLRSPRAQVPAAATLIVALVLDGDLTEMTDDVLHLGVAAATALAAKVVKPFNLVHQVVDDGDDNLEKTRMSVI